MSRPKALDEYFRSLERFGMKPGLERIAHLLEALGSPHHRFRAVHIAGSNGKGSTATFIAGALQAAGLRVGLYTSPHLQRYNERIKVQAEPISDDALTRLLRKIRPHAEALEAEWGSPTEFEVGTALAFEHFASEGVDVAVIETGLGGRLDATNVVDPLLSVITPITIDHREILGDSLGAVAGEKAGIIKPGRPVVIAPQADEALQALLNRARVVGAPATLVLPQDASLGPYPTHRFRMGNLSREGGQVELLYGDGSQAFFRVGMLGQHQLVNGAVAAAALRELAHTYTQITDTAVAHSLREARVPGRLELLGDGPGFLLDGAHNSLGAQYLAQAFERFFVDRKIALLIGVSQDKPASEIMRWLLPHAWQVIATEPTATRLGCWSSEELARTAGELGARQVKAIQDVREALEYAAEQVGPDGIVCVTGSLYLVGEVRSLLTG